MSENEPARGMDNKLKLFLSAVALMGLILIGGYAHELGDWTHDRVSAIRTEVAHSLEDEINGIGIETIDDAIEKHLIHEPLLYVVLRDVGIALLVAVFLTVVIEHQARMKLQTEITTGIVEACFRSMVPESIFEEVRDQVLKAKSLKKNWVLNMHVRPDKDALLGDEDLFICRTRISYDIVNVSTSVVPLRISGNLDKDKTAGTGSSRLPRYERLLLGDEELTGEALETALHNAGCSYDLTREVKSNDSMHVEVEVQEIIRIPDTFVWNMNVATKDVRIDITVDHGMEDICFEVMALHPQKGRLKTTGRQSWTFPGVLLPWQGFQIYGFRKS